MTRFYACLLILAFVLVAAAPASAQRNKKEEQSLRALHGQVTDAGDNILEKAVVYLKDTRTLAVKTFITPKDGNYHFHGLSPNVDYEVRAEFGAQQSATRTLSSFDGRKEVYLNLKVENKK